MKRVLFFALAIAGAAAMVCSCGNKSKKAESEAAEAAEAAAKEARLAEVVAQKIDSLPAEPVFDIITNMGIIKVKLYESTPKHRENFARLAFSCHSHSVLCLIDSPEAILNFIQSSHHVINLLVTSLNNGT